MIKIATTVRNDNKSIIAVLPVTDVTTTTQSLNAILEAAGIHARGKDIDLEMFSTTGTLYYSKETPATASNSFRLEAKIGLPLKLRLDDYVAAASGTVQIQALVYDS